MSRTGQDSVIDDDEETCPLCIEEFDLSDKNFRPCPCGYQICQFCFNSLKTTYEKSTCPNCRRPYDEKTIQYKPPTTEEYRVDQTKKRQAAQKRKEIEKREVETSSRRNLAGVRVKQQNLVYVIGLVPSVKDENTLLQTLRGDSYFGQYGEIDKIVVSKAKSTAANQGIGVYVTYAKNEDAALCISMVDGSSNGDRVLRAQYGTTKYCSAYLRGETCSNKNCSFLHESGEDGQSTSLQNEPIAGKPTTRPLQSSLPSQQQPAHRPTQIATQAIPTSQPMRRQGSKDEGGDRKSSTDGSALPSSASWANKDAHVSRTRRESQAASRGSPSPLVAQAALATQKAESKRKESTTPSISAPAFTPPVAKAAPSQAASSGKSSPPPSKPKDDVLDELITAINSTDLRFRFNDAMFSPEELAALDRYPCMIDPYGGAKRRLQREKDAAQLAKLEAEAQAKVPSTVQAAAETLEDEDPTSGSLQLGGEPEENPRSNSQNYGKMTSVIGRPTQQFGGTGGISDQFPNLSINGQDLTPQHRQQLAVLTNASHAPGLGQPQQGFSSLEHPDHRPNPFQNQQSHYESMHGHARQSSRFTFANDTAKPMVNTQFQQPRAATQQHFYSSGVQGPPPGLKTAGTPPISGGGMFAQGYGFTSNMNNTFSGHKDENSSMLMRGRSGTGSGHDVAKREYLLSLQSSHRSPPPYAPAPGLSNSLYGPYAGVYQDPGLVKQKRKGKKHRHANTSSSGGGVVDLADPSILQARIHQAGAGGQGPFGGQSQDDQEFPPLAPPSKSKPIIKPPTHSTHVSRDSSVRSITPKVPPGFSLPHAHPSPGNEPSSANAGKAISAPTSGVTSALPVSSEFQHSPTPSPKPKEPGTTAETVNAGEASKSDDPKSAKTDLKESNKAPVPPKSNDAASTRKIRAQSSGSPVQRPSKQAQSIDKSDSKSKKSEVAGKLNIDTTTPTVNAVSKGTDSSTSASATRPRTLRLTTVSTPKNDSMPMSAATDKSTSFPPLSGIKQLHSRQPSVSDVSRNSRPSTPTVSDNLNSAEISRAGSPPPTSAVGSGAEKAKTKSQLKKERKAKAKEESEQKPKEEDSKPATSATEDIAPIISHQKKKRKEKPVKASAANSSGKPTSQKDEGQAKDSETPRESEGGDDRKPSPVTGSGAHEPQNQTDTPTTAKPAEDESTKPESNTAKPLAPVAPEQKMTVKALYEAASSQASQAVTSTDSNNNNASSSSTAISSLLTSYFTPARTQKILEDMRARDLISPQNTFFAPPQPLSSYRLPPEQLRQTAKASTGGAGGGGGISNTIYLTAAARSALMHGEAVHVFHPYSNSGGGSNAGTIAGGGAGAGAGMRTMISPSGTIYRHLSVAEESRALELERALSDAHATYASSCLGDLEFPNLFDIDDGDGDGNGNVVGPTTMAMADVMNVSGDLNYLFSNAEQFGIVLEPSAAATTSAGANGEEDGEDDDDDDEDEDDDDEDIPVTAAGIGALVESGVVDGGSGSTLRLAAERAKTSLINALTDPEETPAGMAATATAAARDLGFDHHHHLTSATGLAAATVGKSPGGTSSKPSATMGVGVGAKTVEELLAQVKKLDVEALGRRMMECEREMESWKRKVEVAERGLVKNRGGSGGGVGKEREREMGGLWGLGRAVK